MSSDSNDFFDSDSSESSIDYEESGDEVEVHKVTSRSDISAILAARDKFEGKLRVF